MSSRRDRRIGLALAAISALALGLRLFRLDFQSFWSDEIGSLAMAGATLAECLERVGADVHPPLYFVLLHAWVELFGNSEFAVRLFSALPSALAVPAIFRLGARLLGARAALVAAAICALSTFQIYYAQEARSYALASLLAVLSMDAFSEWQSGERRGARRRASFFYYVLATTALLYTHYFGIFLVVVQNLWLIGSRLRGRLADESREPLAASLGGWLGAQLAVAALLVPWLPALFGQTHSVGSGDFWIREPGAYMLLRSLLIGISLHRPPWGFLIPWAALARNFLLLALAFGLIAHFWRSRGLVSTQREAGQKSEGQSVGVASQASWLLIALWLVVPALVAFALSTLSINVYTHRNLIVSSPALFLMLGGLFASLPGRALPALLLAASLAPSLSFYPWYYGSVHKGQWREMTTWLSKRAEAEDGFVFDAPFIRRNYDFYRGARDYRLLDVRQKRKPRQRRIWLVRAHQAAGENRIPRAVEAWGYSAAPPERFRDIEVFLYERR